MKTVLKIIAVLLLVLTVRAQVSVTSIVGVGKIGSGRYGIGAGTIHNHPETPLMFENFEGTGYLMAGWEEYLAGTGNSINPDNVTNVLSGSQSLAIVGISDDPSYITNSFTPSSELWGYMEFKVIKYPDEIEDTFRQVLRLETESGEQVFNIVSGVTGSLYIEAGGQANVPNVGALALNTTYYIWWYWNKNDGANSQATLAISTTKVKPTSGDNFTSITGNPIASDAARIMIGYDNTSAEFDPNIGGTFFGAPSWIYDYILIDDVEIQSYP